MIDLLTFLKTHPNYISKTDATDAVALAWTKDPVTVQRDATNGDVLAWAAGALLAALKAIDDPVAYPVPQDAADVPLVFPRRVTSL